MKVPLLSVSGRSRAATSVEITTAPLLSAPLNTAAPSARGSPDIGSGLSSASRSSGGVLPSFLSVSARPRAAT